MLIVVVLAASALAAAAAVGGPLPADRTAIAITLTGLLVVSEMRPMQWHPRGGEFTASWGFAGALAMLVPAVYAMAALLVASIFGDLVSRKPPDRVLFNASSLTLSLGAGIAMLHALHFDQLADGSSIPWWAIVTTAVFAVTVFMTNLGLVATIIHLDRGVPIRTIVTTAVPQSLADDLLLLAMSPVFAVVGLRSLPMLVLPLVAVVAVHGSARRAAESRIAATRDGLTGLVHREEFVSAVEGTIPSGGTIVMLDLDGFKAINDRFGHAAGDQTLEIVAKRLLGAVRPTDVVARVGGDEFAIVIELPAGRDSDAAVERIRTAVQAPLEIDGVPLPLQASVGVATAPEHGTDVDALLDRADSEMLTIKLQRRGVLPTHTTEGSSFASQLDLLRSLRRALDEDDLEVAYQPQVEIFSGETVGFEALVRWRRDGELVGPNEFIAAAEHTELIRPLTDRVLGQALEACAGWWHRGDRLPVAVNVSARSLLDPRLVHTIRTHLDATDLPGAALEIEFTESSLLVDVAAAAETLEELRSEGVSLAIDDFGTGFSSFEHLRSLPVGKVKIDRSFVGVDGGSADSRFLGPIITLAHNLGISVVAEGVERVGVHRMLSELGCDAGQGWFYSRPLAEEEAREWLERPGEDDHVGGVSDAMTR